MKNMKRIASFILALVMVLCLTTTAFAIDGGSITIDNALVGETYSIYRIFDIESYDTTSGNYSYVVSEKWKGFTAAGYFTVNDDGYVTWAEGKDSEAGAAEFAKLAMEYATNNNIAPDASKKAESTTVEFTALTLGYYLVDTTLGSICSLDTTNPDVIIKEKNEQPSIDKNVEEDVSGEYGKNNDADITQTVNFQTEITVQKGTEQYVLHDTMDAGLTFSGSVKVTVGETEIASEGNWTLIASPDDGHTFDVNFEDSYIATLEAGTKIVVSYSATLNESAVVAGDGNKNIATLSYGDAQKTAEVQTVTKTWKVDVFKYTGTDTPLAGAEFILYKGEQYAKFTKIEAVTSDDGVTTPAYYKFAGWGTEVDATKIISGDDGYIRIEGLDADTYTLKETAAPAGYNLLKGTVNFTISNEGAVSVNGTSVENVAIQNNAGSELPSTGGMGTTLFYTIGGLMMLAAVVLLVTKKRMAA